MIGVLMCLACELDALWYAEQDRLVAEGAADAGSPGTAGVPPGVSEPASGTESKNTDETPAVRQRPAASRSSFRCEEAE
jgi:hypothetical protein